MKNETSNTQSPNRRDFLKQAVGVGAGIAWAGSALTASAAGQRPATHSNLLGFQAPKLDRVRLGFIGVGARGSGHVQQCLMLDGVDVVAICDTHAPSAERSAEACEKAGRPRPELYTRGDEDYRRMLERDDIDAVITATPWRWHTPMSLHAMEAGKHAFVEVPAAITVEECWALVETAEKTQRHCMMMENVNYGREELMVLNMCRQGLFGELVHGEAAYIHDLRFQMKEVERGTGSWRTKYHTTEDGNLYPTHGLGPIAQYMNINRGDRFDYLTSMSSPALGRQLYAKENFPADHMRNQVKYICGDMNSSLIKTVRGRSILVQHDTTSPRPYNRLNFIQGTRGAFGGFPDRIVVEGRGTTHEWTEGDNLAPYFKEFEHPLWTRVGEEATKAGGHGGMDFMMLWRMMYCLRNGEAMDQDVYDAAAWSVIRPLSAQSVANRSQSVDVPDFTRGGWKTAEPLGVIA